MNTISHFEYTLKVYTFVKNNIMKTLSLKLDDNTFIETEKMTSQLNMARNRYINEALHVFNLYNKRKLLKKQLIKESKAVASDSLDILHELENLIDED